MLKLITLAFIAVAFAAEDAGEVKPNPSTNNDASQQEIVDKYRDEYLKYQGKSVSALTKGSSEVQPSDIKFYFYGAPNQENVQVGTVDDPEFPKYFNASYETKVYIHGWLQENDNNTYFYIPMKYAFRGQRKNIIIVDWSSHSYNPEFYPHVVNDVAPKVASYVQQMLRRLVAKGAEEKRVHLIGFGVGAHIAGLTGKLFSSPKIGRITGLSPTGPFYNNKPESERLAKGDADFVDVIHTNMGTLGISKAIGDVDFLPNGGRVQPVAQNYNTIQRFIVSHLAAHDYYMESIEYGYAGFLGKKCGSWHDFAVQKCALNPSEVMGENISREVQGTVYFSVNARSPYSRGVVGAYSIGPYPSPMEE